MNQFSGVGLYLLVDENMILIEKWDAKSVLLRLLII